MSEVVQKEGERGLPPRWWLMGRAWRWMAPTGRVDWEAWQVHAVVIVVACVLLQYALWVAYVWFPWLFAQLLLLTLNTNLLALFYALFGYRIYDKKRQVTVRAMNTEGVPLMDLEEAVTRIATFARLATAWWKTNETVLTEIGVRVKGMDLREAARQVENFTKVLKVLEESGWNVETLERAKPHLMRMAEVMPRFAVVLPAVADLVERTDPGKLVKSINTAAAMMNGKPSKAVETKP